MITKTIRELAVYDCYARGPGNQLCHFDIFVDSQSHDWIEAKTFALTWLAERFGDKSAVELDLCRYCHSEQPSPEALRQIALQGFYAIELPAPPAIIRTAQ